MPTGGEYYKRGKRVKACGPIPLRYATHLLGQCSEAKAKTKLSFLRFDPLVLGTNLKIAVAIFAANLSQVGNFWSIFSISVLQESVGSEFFVQKTTVDLG
jgi:hypothetical protein